MNILGDVDNITTEQWLFFHDERYICLYEAVRRGIADTDAIMFHKKYLRIAREYEEARDAARSEYQSRWEVENGLAWTPPEPPMMLNAEEKRNIDRVMDFERSLEEYNKLSEEFLQIFNPVDQEYRKKERRLQPFLGYWYTTFCSEDLRIEVRTAFEKNIRKPGKSDASKITVSPRPTPLPSDLIFSSNNVHGAGVYALGAASTWQKNPVAGIALGVTRNYKDLQITVGLPDNAQSQSLWEYIAAGGPRMVKAHYALSARWYENGGEATGFTTVNISQFCSDLGYTKHPKGGFRREHKQESVKILETLTSVELRATFIKPGTKPGSEREVRLRGSLWSRGLIAEERDKFNDLFGQAREGSSSDWEPQAFTFGPGPFFSDPNWRDYNKAVGKIGVGLMKLDNRNDEWALLIGGYFGTIMRADQYAPKRLKIGTILRQTNLAQGKDWDRRKSQVMSKLEKALDRLVEVDVISSWTWPGVDITDIDDIDDPQAIADYFSEDTLPAGDWKSSLVEIIPPVKRDADRQRLQKGEAKAVQKTKAAKARRENALILQ